MTRKKLSIYLFAAGLISGYVAFELIPDWWLVGPLGGFAAVALFASHLLHHERPFNWKRVGDPPIIDPSHIAQAPTKRTGK